MQNPWRVRRDPTAPNLCQVHLLPAELLEHLTDAGFTLRPGELGENITTRGLDLEALPLGTLLHLGSDAVIRLTGLRDPCRRINSVRPRLLKEVLYRDNDTIVRRAGVMGVVVASGTVAAGAPVRPEPPGAPHVPLPAV